MTVYHILAVVCAAWILTLLLGGYRLWCAHVTIQAERRTVATLRAEHTAERKHLALKYGEALKLTIAANDRADAAEADAEWSEVMRAVLLAEIDRHDTSHVCLPSLDGIRAGRVPAREGEEPPISRSLSTAPVVRLHKKGAK